MRLRLEPSDEYMHPTEDAKNFNESMYFNVYDPDRRVGGWFRLGNRPNEGYAEMTCCLYLPDGSVGFMFQRPRIDGNDRFDAGGMRFEVVRPFEELTVSYTGKVCLLAEPTQMADPRSAFRDNPHVDARVELTYTGVSEMMGGEPVNDDGTPITQDAETGFARGHYEQHVAATGTIEVGDRTWEIDGYGLRDHSWGPRYWQSPWWYRWLTMNFGRDLGFMVNTNGDREGRVTGTGVLMRDGRYTRLADARIDTVWSDDGHHLQRALKVWCRTVDGDEYRIDGDVISIIPLRNRRTAPDGTELMTRIGEGMTRWTLTGPAELADRVGYGLSEYLDQIVDGRPVGVDH